MLTTFAFALLAAAAPLQDPTTGTIRGQVRSERTDEPLPFAVVEIVGAASPLVAVADSAGVYILRDVPAGRRRLRARGFDHAPLEVEVLIRAGRETTVDLALAFRPVVLEPVTVEAKGLPPLSDTLAAPAAELSRATIRSLEATPGVVELGLGELVHGSPGQEPVDPGSVLYVRGAPADLKLVLLDGAPIYAPFHLAGLIQAFQPELLRNVDLYLGGAPARYDGGLSYVLDLETRAGRRSRVHSSGSIDLLSADGQIEGPIGSGAGFLVGARAVHGLGADWMLPETFPYAYGDALGRLDMSIGTGRSIGVTGFWNHESIRLADGSPDAATWGNAAGSIRFRGPLGGADAEITAAFGSYRARLPLDDSAIPVIADGMADRARFAADFTRSIGSTRLHYGLSYERISLDYGLSSGTFGTADESFLETEARGETGGGYVDVALRPAPRLRLRGGIRADYYVGDASPRLAPRFSATWLLSDRAAVTLAAGVYSQFIRSGGPKLVSEPLSSQTSLWIPPPLTIARASHVVVGLDQMLADDIRLGIEGYYKHFEGLPSAVPLSTGPMNGLAGDVGSAAAQASGVDFWLRRGEGRYTGWFGYSLAWVWSSRADQAADLFSGRQILSAGLAGPIGGRGRFDVRVGYGSGLPFTAIPTTTDMSPPVETLRSNYQVASFQNARNAVTEAPPLAGRPDDPYLRLDVQVEHPWAARWGGRPVTITPYLKVLNALDRRDALFYRADGGNDPRPVASLPFLPILGVQWRF